MTQTAAPRLAGVHRLEATEAVARLLAPRGVALVGASNDAEKFSGQPLRNLVSRGYPGTIVPVNRRGGEIGGVPAVSRVADLPAGIDVAMVMLPAAACPETIRELGAAGVRVAIVAVSGFAEMGTPEGQAIQDELATAGTEAGVRIVGPNCNGIYGTHLPLPLGYNHTHSLRLRRGSVALVSHSGAMLGGFAPLLEGYGAGLSMFVSCGNEVDLELTDYVDHLVNDPDTSVIALILDGISDGKAFRASLARARAVGKPVVALKLGNSPTGSSAAQAHSSRLAGPQASYEAVFTAERVVSVPTLETLALAAAQLATGRTPRTPGVVGFSTSGAGGILLADTLGSHAVGLTTLSSGTVEKMTPSAGFARVMNPFDIGAAGPSSIAAHLTALADDPGTGTLLFYLTPTPTQRWRQMLADGVAEAARCHPDLPVVVVSPASISADEAAAYASASVPVAGSLLDAVVAVAATVRASIPQHEVGAVESAGHGSTRGPGAGLSEPASKSFLIERGVRFPPEHLVTDHAAARIAADEIGYPVVLKAAGCGISHKSEHGLVVADVDGDVIEETFADLATRGRSLDPVGYEGVVVAPQVDGGIEVVVGVTVDPTFGPMVLFGAGGVLTELIADVAVAPAPLNPEGAAALIRSTKIAALLAGYRGDPPADVDALVELLVRVSRIATQDADALEAIDLNPVRVLPVGAGLAILDALVVRR